MSRARILVVDDDRAVRTALSVNLTKHGLDVTLANSPDDALGLLREAAFDLVLTDVKMPGGTGIDLLMAVKTHWPETEVVVMTGYGSVTDAVAAMKAGAIDYVIKPIEKSELLVIVDKALDNRALRAELRQLRQEVVDRYGFHNLIGTTPAMQALYEEIAAVADTDATVLLEGPTGTGKELLSHALHHRSRRAGGPFVRVNCAAIPATLLESELFGHERGAFTGAVRQHIGKFEQADGGTLLLDEIGEIDLHMQVKLLRVLENGELSRVGGTGTIRVDVRIVAATNRDLREEVRAHRFREDLYYRLHVFHLKVPSLRERKADIPLLVEHFLTKYNEKTRKNVVGLTRTALEALVAHDWPGNVRELEHAIERAVILCKGDTIEQIHLMDGAPEPVASGSVLPPVGTPLKDALLDYEKRVIIEALRESEGVQARAARRLGISRSNLNYRIGRLDIQLTGLDYE
ncbi:MAG: sigma-54 dependent transcriptional regulator [Myxococcota bacterium]